MKAKKGQKPQTMESQMREFITCKRIDEELIQLFEQDKSEKIRLLWSIWFETDFSQLNQLEEKIFAYGNLLKETDYLEREIFVYMFTVLRQLKLHEEERIREIGQKGYKTLITPREVFWLVVAGKPLFHAFWYANSAKTLYSEREYHIIIKYDYFAGTIQRIKNDKKEA